MQRRYCRLLESGMELTRAKCLKVETSDSVAGLKVENLEGVVDGAGE